MNADEHLNAVGPNHDSLQHYPELRHLCCQAHAPVRVAGILVLWFLRPEPRFTLLPLFVAVICAFPVVGRRREVARARQEIDGMP